MKISDSPQQTNQTFFYKTKFNFREKNEHLLYRSDGRVHLQRFRDSFGSIITDIVIPQPVHAEKRLKENKSVFFVDGE